VFLSSSLDESSSRTATLIVPVHPAGFGGCIDRTLGDEIRNGLSRKAAGRNLLLRPPKSGFVRRAERRTNRIISDLAWWCLRANREYSHNGVYRVARWPASRGRARWLDLHRIASPKWGMNAVLERGVRFADKSVCWIYPRSPENEPLVRDRSILCEKSRLAGSFWIA